MKEIVFFSNNKNKINENLIYLKSSFNILNLNNFKKIKSPKEIGKTFEENAKIKSLLWIKKFNKICFADDSGICIEAMNDKPGVNSNEFLNSNKNKKDITKS